MEMLLGGIVAAALAVAVAMGVIAWRVLSRDRAREHARVAMLQSLAADPPDLALSAPVAPGSVLLEARPHTGTGAWAVVLMAVIGLSAGAGVVYALYRPDTNPTASTAARSAAPLELVALSHARSTDDVFQVSGVVANPVGGRPTTRLMAVVSLFDTNGGYLTSGKALVEFPAVAPGDESPFVLRVPTGGRIARYRLTFREDAGGPLAHVDRRLSPREGLASDIEVARQ